MAGVVRTVDWFKKKSVKLSDSFLVVFNGAESYRCGGFTIPKVAEFNEEVHKFGNTSHKMLIPKIDLVQELTVELYEGYHVTGKGKNAVTGLASESFFWKIGEGGFNKGQGYVNYADYDKSGYNRLRGQYTLNKPDVKTLSILILNNKMNKVVYKYEFTNLTLTKWTPYELSYADESITKWSLSFTFEYFTKGAVNEPVG